MLVSFIKPAKLGLVANFPFSRCFNFLQSLNYRGTLFGFSTISHIVSNRGVGRNRTCNSVGIHDFLPCVIILHSFELCILHPNFSNELTANATSPHVLFKELSIFFITNNSFKLLINSVSFICFNFYIKILKNYGNYKEKSPFI